MLIINNTCHFPLIIKQTVTEFPTFINKPLYKLLTQILFTLITAVHTH